MNKRLGFIIIILFAILILIVRSTIIPDKKQTPVKEKTKIVKINDFKNYNYIHSSTTMNFQDKILIYDKNTLTLLNKDLKEEFKSNILINDYEISVNNDYIFLLDKTGKKLYKIDSDGVVVGETEIGKNVLNVYALRSSKVLVTYTTDVSVDGVVLLDEKLEMIEDLTYSDNIINVISQNQVTGDIIVSSLIKTVSDVKCKMYYYNEKFELLMTESFDNMIAMDVEFRDDSLIILDPDFMYIFDSKFENSNKVPSSDYFSDIAVSSKKIYLLDGKRKLIMIDENHNTSQDFSQDSDIIGLFTYNDTPVVCKERQIIIDKEEIKTQNDIKKAFSLNKNGICLIFRNGIKVINP